jgi:hypothetical protein
MKEVDDLRLMYKTLRKRKKRQGVAYLRSTKEKKRREL